ncbi:hypothetical protein M405DRAFT_886418 [Rhizopogon salebrosus TDB-379]|nr:hypothetical protein M405DRAFT_886418 [Rhizopogon salebrosus TDB-379]
MYGKRIMSTPDGLRHFGFSLELSLLNLFRYHTFTTAVRITNTNRYTAMADEPSLSVSLMAFEVVLLVHLGLSTDCRRERPSRFGNAAVGIITQIPTPGFSGWLAMVTTCLAFKWQFRRSSNYEALLSCSISFGVSHVQMGTLYLGVQIHGPTLYIVPVVQQTLSL